MKKLNKNNPLRRSTCFIKRIDYKTNIIKIENNKAVYY